MVPSDDNNNDDEFDGPPKYDYCCPNTDPDFGLHPSLMSITYSGCDVKK